MPSLMECADPNMIINSEWCKTHHQSVCHHVPFRSEQYVVFLYTDFRLSKKVFVYFKLFTLKVSPYIVYSELYESSIDTLRYESALCCESKSIMYVKISFNWISTIFSVSISGIFDEIWLYKMSEQLGSFTHQPRLHWENAIFN